MKKIQAGGIVRAVRFCAGPAGTMFAGEELATKNGLEVAWDWPVFVNPPYGKELTAWLLKVAREAARGTVVLALLPCNRWESAVLPKVLSQARCVFFHRGRVAFVSSIDGAPVPGNPYASMILGFNVDPDRFTSTLSPLGACFELRPLHRVRLAENLGAEPWEAARAAGALEPARAKVKGGTCRRCGTATLSAKKKVCDPCAVQAKGSVTLGARSGHKVIAEDDDPALGLSNRRREET